MSRVGVYLGSPSTDVTNIENVLKTWVRCLVEADHDIELIGGTNVPTFSSSCVTSRGVFTQNTVTPFGKIKDSYGHLSRYISKCNPDILIQIWKYQTHAPAVSIAGKRYDVPTVVRVTGDVFREFLGFDLPRSLGVFALDNLVGQVPLHIASKFVVMGPNLKQSVQARGVSGECIHLIPPPQPDRSRFSSGVARDEVFTETGIDNDRPVVLFVGRLSQQKGMDFLSEVIDETLSRTEYQFVLVGDGPYREVFRERFSPGQVVLPGQVSREQIPRFYRTATVYVHPSRFEGIPLVILEALQSGVPVIARAAGDVDFVIEEVVQTERQMVDSLTRQDWNKTWQNKDYFRRKYQCEEITRLINELK